MVRGEPPSVRRRPSPSTVRAPHTQWRRVLDPADASQPALVRDVVNETEHRLAERREQIHQQRLPARTFGLAFARPR